jgi:hypothetical protein
LEFARDAKNAPEARLLAAAKIEAEFAVATEDRRVRPKDITLELVKAAVAGVNSQHWRSSQYYCSLLDERFAPGEPRPPQREVPLEG